MTRPTMILAAILLSFTMNAQSIILPTGSKGITKSNDQFSGFQATFSYDQIESVAITGTERGMFSAINIAGAYPQGEYGMPQLPVFKKMIAIPVGATPKVLAKKYTTAEYRLEEYGIHTIIPTQPSVRKDQTDIPFIYDEKAYLMDEYNHALMVEIEVLGTMRGMILGMLTVRPVQYNPVAHTILAHNNIEIEVTFENGDYTRTQDLFKNTYSPYFAKHYSAVFNNGTYRNVYLNNPDLYSTPVRVLVIANRMFEATLQPWIQWKTKKGFYMDVNYTDVIGTTAAAIKTFCHNKYTQGASNGTAPTFIIIVGDTPQVPASQNGSSTGVATDLYYATLGTGYFPSMYYSRMSAQTTQQLANIIEKTLYYEQYQFADPSYLDNVLLIAGADGTWNPIAGQPQINYANTHYYNAANGYVNIHKFLTSYTNCYSHLNNVGFANFTAHCSQTTWSDPTLTIAMVNALTNVNKYYVAIGNCCQAADFGYGECMGEAQIRAHQKGAVGYIGSSPNSYWHDDFHFTVGAYSGAWTPACNPTMQNTTDGMYDLMFRDADFNTLCSHVFAGNLAVTYAMTTPGYNTDMTPRYYWEAYNVLGDGSLMPYNGQAADNTVSHLPILPIGITSYEVTAIPGSYAAISKDGVLYGVAVADATGVANVVLNPPILAGGDVDIVVTRNQYKPYITQVPAAALVGPYVINNGYAVVNEPELTYISTNSQIAVTLKNIGADPTEGALTVTISCTDPQLTINSATAYCGMLNADGTTTVNFNVTVANDIPDNKIFPAKLIVTDIDNTTWESNLSLKAYAPDFSLEKVFVNGVEDGNLAPGATTTLTLVVKNKGNADAYAVTGEITTGSVHITYACEIQNTAAQNLPAGETINLTFVIITSPTMPLGHNANFNLLLTADYGRTHAASFTTSYTGAANYCTPGTTGCSSDRFTLVRLVKTSDQSVIFNNTDGTCITGGYRDFTSTTATLHPGERYTITVSVAYQNNTVRGWFDLNGNKVFDANEQLINNITTGAANTQASQTFTIPENTAPGTYRFRLRTRDGGAPQPCDAYQWGQTHDYTVVIPDLYPRVQNVVAALNGTSINITWDAPGGQTPAGYNIYRNGNRLNTALLTNPTFTESGLSQGVYVYNVTAVFAGNKESLAQMSNVICLQGDELPCEIPVNLSGIKEVNTAVISWDEPQNMTGTLVKYNVYRNTTNIGETLPTVREYSDANLANGTYTYQVSAVYEECESALTSGVTIVIEAYAVNYNTPENGTLSVTGTAAIASGALVNANTVITITATPVNAERYRLGTLTVNGSNFTSGNNHTVTGVTNINCSFVGIDPTLTAMTINDNQTINVSNNMFHMAACGKANVVLSNLASEGTIRIGGNVYVPGMTVPFVDDKAVINVHITGVTDMNYTLVVTKALGSAAMPMYIQRWGKVLAVVNNPDRNGGHTFDNYRWYLNGIPQQSATGGYILLDGRQPINYAAEVHSIKTSEWHELCHNVIIGQNQSAITVYPNPVEAGGLLSLNLPEDVDKVNVNVYDISGNLVRQQKGVHSAVTMPSQTGMYIVEIQLPDGTSNTQQVIVQ